MSSPGDHRAPSLQNTQTHTNRNTLTVLSMYSCTVDKADNGRLWGLTDSQHFLLTVSEEVRETYEAG